MYLPAVFVHHAMAKQNEVRFLVVEGRLSNRISYYDGVSLPPQRTTSCVANVFAEGIYG